MCTVKPQFYILAFCVFPYFTHFLHSPGQIPTRTLFSRLYTILWWSHRKRKIRVLLYLETYVKDVAAGVFLIFLPFIPLSWYWYSVRRTVVYAKNNHYCAVLCSCSYCLFLACCNMVAGLFSPLQTDYKKGQWLLPRIATGKSKQECILVSWS